MSRLSEALLSEEAIEHAARAQYAVEASILDPTWERQNSLVQDNYRRSVRAAITAALIVATSPDSGVPGA